MSGSDRTWRRVLLVTSAIALAGGSAGAQTVKIWPGVAPGSEHWTQQERTFTNTPLGTVIQNVVTPTLTAYLPPKGKATGAGLVIAPGGGFVALAIDLEANQLARWLQQRGVAAFVLKYRTVEKKQDGIPAMDMDTAGRYGIADGIQAPVVRFRDALVKAGIRPEVHEYDAGGHGFGMRKQGTSSDRWVDDFWRWLEPLVYPSTRQRQ